MNGKGVSAQAIYRKGADFSRISCSDARARLPVAGASAAASGYKTRTVGLRGGRGACGSCASPAPCPLRGAQARFSAGGKPSSRPPEHPGAGAPTASATGAGEGRGTGTGRDGTRRAGRLREGRLLSPMAGSGKRCITSASSRRLLAALATPSDALSLVPAAAPPVFHSRRWPRGRGPLCAGLLPASPVAGSVFVPLQSPEPQGSSAALADGWVLRHTGHLGVR